MGAYRVAVDAIARARLLRKRARHAVEQARSNVLRSRALAIRGVQR
jgi:hypothetical protein